jgi:Zn-dependent protease with chaperone function
MNFFEHQDAARKRTGRLVVLFGLAVVAIVASIYLVVALLLAANDSREGVVDQPQDLWNPRLLAAVAIGCRTVILVGSMYRTATLGAGGKVIAETLGGRLLEGKGQDWRERRLLNVVEEMALAAGMPVPAVYVMDREEGINAFAAGFTPTDAVIGVTRGTINTLTRDELQGVIAHEFSHILNGDMRLNLRLVGVLHGILLISLIGYYIMRALGNSRTTSSSRSSSSDKKDGGAGIVMAIFLFGLALAVIGYIGVFFGKLIKSAVSRQREYLADASAVQFTRDPLGIGGALKKIGALGSKLTNSQAEQASHMFFGNALGQAFLSMLSTHPPLVDRVRRIEPTFDGDFDPKLLHWPTADEAEAEQPKKAASRDPLSIPGLGKIPGVGRLPGMEGIPGADVPILEGAMGMAPLSARQAVETVGEPQARHLDFAAALLEQIPRSLADEIHDPAGAAAVVYALLLAADESDDEAGLRLLTRQIDLPTSERVRALVRRIEPLGPTARLPLAQLTMTALRGLTADAADRFRQAVVALIRADRRVSIFEYALQRLIIKHLLAHLKPRRPQRVRYKNPADAVPHARVIVAALAYAGNGDAESATRAYQAGVEGFLGGPAASDGRGMPARDKAGYSELDAALDEMAAASGDVKRRVLEAAAATIGHDGRMTINEAELLRTVADALDCPMPPPAAELIAG